MVGEPMEPGRPVDPDPGPEPSGPGGAAGPRGARDAWAEVGRQFEELGRALGEHFSRPDAATWRASSTEPGGRDDRRAVMDALRRAGEAAQQLGDQAGEAVRDPHLRESARSATRGLADALESTFGGLVEQLRGASGPGAGSGAGSGAASGGAAERPDPDAWSRTADPGVPRAIVDPVPADPEPAAPDAGPQTTPGPDPDPSPGDGPSAQQAPTRPPSDS